MGQQSFRRNFLGISFGSINTGLPKDIVKQIIDAERIPIQKMEARKAKVENKEGLLADLIQRVEKLRGSIYANKGERSFQEFGVKISDESALSAVVDKNIATAGAYQIEVMQLAQKSSAISNGVADKDETFLGVGYLQYKLPNGETRDVYVDTEHSSLTGIAKLINQDSDNGMHATVINSGDESDEPWKIIIALEETGDSNEAVFPNLYLVDGEVDLWFDSERKAQDAKIKLDGFEIEIPSNKATEIIPGVTLDLKKAKLGEEITLEIFEDTNKMGEKITELVDNVNEVLKFIKEQNALDEATDTSSTLGGDLTLQTLESRIRSAVFQDVSTEAGLRKIGELGLKFQRNGLLALDQEKFQTQIDKNYKSAVQLITGRYTQEEGKISGFIDNLENMASNSLRRPGGVLSSRKEGLKSQIDQIDRRIANRQRHIERKEKVLKEKFARLEETISRIQSQGSGLAGLAGGAMNPVTQLG